MRLKLSILVLSCSIWKCLEAVEEEDKVDLPGLPYPINYGIYSGFLNANEEATWKMHYLLFESKSIPSTDPLLVWFNGGPGCSSLAGAFTELGPFYVNLDGKTLFENKYSWNERANVLFLESPIGVGFSHDITDPNFHNASDDQTADMNFRALQDFFTRVQPKYKNRHFFLSGESYAGVYIPMLSLLLAKGINNGSFPNVKFEGSAIGNGYMHVEHVLNAQVLWSYYHGKISLDDWNFLKENCSEGALRKYDMDTYNFFQYLDTNDVFIFESDRSTCGDIIYNSFNAATSEDRYNYYQDCYKSDWNQTIDAEVLSLLKTKRRSSSTTDKGTQTSAEKLNLNYKSTDPLDGYACWMDSAVDNYMNRPDVMEALHIPDDWLQNNTWRYKWNDCSKAVYGYYNMTWRDQSKFFREFIEENRNPNFRFLIYTGDVDTMITALGVSWFVDGVVKENSLKTSEKSHKRWIFSGRTAGFVRRHSGKNVLLDVLSVKGAGHFVPLDRPGPALQMINNFMISPNPNYNFTEKTNEENVSFQ